MYAQEGFRALAYFSFYDQFNVYELRGSTVRLTNHILPWYKRLYGSVIFHLQPAWSSPPYVGVSEEGTVRQWALKRPGSSKGQYSATQLRRPIHIHTTCSNTRLQSQHMQPFPLKVKTHVAIQATLRTRVGRLRRACPLTSTPSCICPTLLVQFTRSDKVWTGVSLPGSGSSTVCHQQRIGTRRPSDSQTVERKWEAHNLPLRQNSPSSRQVCWPSISGVSPSVMVMAPVPPSSNASVRAMHWLRSIGRDQIPDS